MKRVNKKTNEKVTALLWITKDKLMFEIYRMIYLASIISFNSYHVEKQKNYASWKIPRKIHVKVVEK